MSFQLRIRGPKPSDNRVVAVQADPDTPTREVIDALQQHLGTDRLFAGTRPITTAGRLGDSDLRDGTLLTVGKPQPPRTPRRGWEAVVVGGPDAGRITPLPLGKHFIGSSPDEVVFIDDREVQQRHAELQVTTELCRLRCITTRSPLYVDGQSTYQTTIDVGQVIRLGATLLEIRRAPVPDADIRPSENGELEFNRPPRIRPKHVENASISLPARPTPSSKKHPFPWMQASLPLIIALGGALLFRQPYFLMFGLMSPAMVIGTRFEQKRSAKRNDQEARIEFHKRVRNLKRDARRIAIDKLHELRHLYPDVSTLYDIATEPRKRLWERRLEDDDFLTLRLGSADQASGVTFRVSSDLREPDPPMLADAPLTVSLPNIGVLGIAGGLEDRRALGRWLLAQVAILHSPRDTSVYLFTDDTAAEDWEWARFLPHLRGSGEGEPLCRIAVTPLAHEDQLRDLTTLLDERKAKREDRSSLGTHTLFPPVVVILDGARQLRKLGGMPRLLREGPKEQLYFVCLDATSSRLPEEGDVILLLDRREKQQAKLARSGEETQAAVVADFVSTPWCEDTARALAPCVDARKEAGSQLLPSFSRLVDVLGVDLDQPDPIMHSWQQRGRTTRAVVGEDGDGPFALDLKHDGPHALVAGTTGAGKSEFLQSLIASLAYVNRPDSMNFVLVDYKGGSAFSECAILPHTVGMVTNLDGHLTERALTALDAELKRRESALRNISAPDVDTAWETKPRETAQARLPRLVLVIDEFAELKHELPDFVDGLVRIARVGRSLGVHLILATQRPAGVVSQEIRANTGLRVGLRMEDKEDSREVLDKPDAAEISRSTPGRAYARLGSNLLLQAFQTSRVAGRRKGNTDGLAPPRITTVSWTELARPLPLPPQDASTEVKTDLYFFAQQATAANEALSIPPQVSPWLPELQSHIVLPADAPPGSYAFADLPSAQSQEWMAFDPESSSTLAVIGGPRTGRSTTLRTIAGSIARAYSPQEVHFYGLDFGDGALQALEALPHTGTLCQRSERDRVMRLIERLNEEVDHRHGVLSQQGVTSIAEQRSLASEGERLPYLVVFLDRWEGFLSEYPLDKGMDTYDTLTRLLREGSSVGIRFVLSGDRALLSDRIRNLCEQILLLKLPSVDDYSTLSIRRSAIPAEMPPGRGIFNGTLIEAQCGLLTEDLSTAGQTESLRTIGAAWSPVVAEWSSSTLLRPFRVELLPIQITYDEVCTTHDVHDFATVRPLIGVGGDELEPLTIDLLADGPFFGVVGPVRSGKSTMATTMARSVLDVGISVICVTPKRSPLESLKSHQNAHFFRGSAEEVPDIIAALEQAGDRALIVVDDIDGVSSAEVHDFLGQIGRNHPEEIGIILTGPQEYFQAAFSSDLTQVRQGRLGVILAPRGTYDGEVFGSRLPERLFGRMPKGRGVLCRHGEMQLVQGCLT